MNWQALLDPVSAGIVLGGTLAATLLRCGPGNTGTAIGQLARIGTRSFSFDSARAQLAAQVAAIRQDGLLRAPSNHCTDPELLDITDSLIRTRSAAALIDTHEAYRNERQQLQARALDTLNTAGDLAPVFGMAGTLFALSQMPVQVGGGVLEAGGIMASVAMAVVTTLYGLLAAHLLFYPLARLVERRAEREDAQRQRLVDWLEIQVTPALKPRTNEGAPAKQPALRNVA